MYSILICDDNGDYIKYIESKILETGIVKKEQVVFKYFYSGEKLIEELNNKDAQCDLLILDIQLPRIDGHQVAKEFRRRFRNSVLVLCSGIYGPTPQSFRVSPYRYILKNCKKEQIIIDREFDT